jgi:putative nucleotidyltransferase with HDIG domain
MTPIHGDKVIEEVRKFDKSLYILLLTGHKDLAPPLQTIREYDIQGYCEKSDNPNQLLLLIESALKSVDQVKTIKKINNDLVESKTQLEKAYLETVEALRLTVEAKDAYTRGHSDRVAYYSRALAKEIGLSEEEQKRIYIGGLFHDIGKIGVPDEILKKAGKLTDDEYSEIKNHPLIGNQIISATSVFEDICPIVKHHHERYDGRGYPGNLKGKDIPLYARISALGDAFDAMTSDRNYRPRLTLQEALLEIQKNCGTQFDPELGLQFIKYVEREKDNISAELNHVFR